LFVSGRVNIVGVCVARNTNAELSISTGVEPFFFNYQYNRVSVDILSFPQSTIYSIWNCDAAFSGFVVVEEILWQDETYNVVRQWPHGLYDKQNK
jgi:hypothetical protein